MAHLCTTDYSKISTDEEKDAQIKYEEYNKPMKLRCSSDDLRFSHPNIECRKFLWRYNSLFPNNFIDTLYYFNSSITKPDYLSEANEYISFLDKNGSENGIQGYIKDNRKWFIPGSIFRDYNFGHHDAYLFPEQMLGTTYRADYMLLGANSDGYSIVLIEFEKADTNFLLSTSNTENENVRKGITQLKDWKRWIDDYRDYFLKDIGLQTKAISIPVSRIHYCVVVSRRKYMDDRAKEVRSQICYEMKNTKIITYDRLADNILLLEANMGPLY